jgi:Flp pilus assembly protein TadG
MSRLSKSFQSQKRTGAAAVELAVVAPFICFLLVITIDYGRLFYYSLTLENGARNGAYYASNYPGLYSFASAQQAASADFQNMNPAPTVDIKYAGSVDGPFASATPIPNGYVQVTTTWVFHTITNYPGVPSAITLQRSCQMKVAPIEPSF